MKTKEELNALKEEAETMNKKHAELTEEELVQVTGGFQDTEIYLESENKGYNVAIFPGTSVFP